jgi:hypothetical protein
MRLILAVALALGAGLLAGCVGGPQSPDGPRGGPMPLTGPTGDDVVQLYVAVVEQPAASRFLTDDVWALADEQSVAPPDGPDVELKWKRLLADNGLRVGLLGGLLPDRLQHLVESGHGCADPRQVRFRAGRPWPIVLGPKWPRCYFRLRLPDGDQELDLEQGQCELQITPALHGPDLALHFTPAVRHGELSLEPRSVKEADGTLRWDMQAQQPIALLEPLSWRLRIAPDEVAVIGGRADKPGTIGHRCFVQEDAETPVQRLLVLRAARAGAAPVSDAALARSLALQAGLTAVRGSGP